jgi:glycosyltransferase involved in cell wall biosynthesis
MPKRVAVSAQYRVVHLTNQTMAHAIPLLKGHRVIITAHDIYPWLTREYPRWSVAFHLQMALALRAMCEADAVVTVSNFSAGEIRKAFPKTAGKIRVIPNGVDLTRFRPINGAREAIAPNIPSDTLIVLSVGSDAPRKGRAALARALAILAKRGYRCLWVRIGPTEWGTEDPVHRIPEELQPRVMDRSNVPDESLALWYNAADVFVFPSFYEGFGLPPLEAMACGTPVITSQRGAIPEVTGNAVLYADPCEPATIADRLFEVLGNGELHKDLSARGRERVKQFTWDHTVQLLCNLYADMGA